MWSYYGSKAILAPLYPKPKFDLIIEPFAGTAQYSLRWFERDIILVDKSPVICRIWEYLKQCSEKDIRDLPKPVLKQRIVPEDYDCQGQYNLMQFLINQGAYWPANIAQHQGLARFDSTKRKIRANLFKIKHWKVINGDYRDIKNRQATWFIDAPYQHGGEKYQFGSKNISYTNLKNYCLLRHGQVIVCENMRADWMNFKPIKLIRGINKKQSIEAIWSNLPTPYDNIQTALKI